MSGQSHQPTVAPVRLAGYFVVRYMSIYKGQLDRENTPSFNLSKDMGIRVLMRDKIRDLRDGWNSVSQFRSDLTKSTVSSTATHKSCYPLPKSK